MVALLDHWGERQAARRLQLALRTDYPNELGLFPCGAAEVAASMVTGEPTRSAAAPRSLAVPRLLRERMSANESSAIGDLRALISAEAAYETAFNRYGTLTNLARPPYDGPAFMGEAFLHGGSPRRGYFLNVSVERRLERRMASLFLRVVERESGYRSFSCPAVPGETGVRYFFTDETGVIRQSTRPILAREDGDPIR
jgi:hypothetical protein